MSEASILKNRVFLYLTEFFAGMSVMAVELGASRLLAPYFSSSQIVWTIIIGTIMIAMALGNVYGGRKADADPDPARLYRRILIAALWIAAIPVAGKYLIMGVSALLIFSLQSGFLVIAAFVSCMLVFVFPLFLLGTVTPTLTRLAARSLDETGRTVGGLGAANTIGSILGTFLPTFVTIPAVGTSVTFLIFAGVLLMLCLVFFFSAGVSKKRGAAGVLIFLLCCLFGHDASFAFWTEGLLYEGESIYNYLQVSEDSRRVILSTNVLFGVQSVYEKDGGLTGMYYDYALAAPCLAAREDKAEGLSVLVLGNGSGTFATLCRRYFPDASVTGVEIDGAITELARRYFSMPEEMEVFEYDGRAFLAADENQYDVILVDAYQDITIPFQMSSVEFFRLVQTHLSPGGVMVVNMNMRGQTQGSITDWLCDTICAVFSEVETVDVAGSTNRVLFARDAASDDMKTALSASAAAFKDETLSGALTRTCDGLVCVTSGGRLLTDDRAPVELLGMRVIDGIIAQEAAYYRQIYEDEGLAGLLERL